MEWDWQPEYNNGHTIIPAPAQAIRPAIEALAAAGLLADTAPRERYAALDQLAPGDRIVWTSHGQTVTREVKAVDVGHDYATVQWADRGVDVLNASVLLRRAAA
jgi:hypothetical protein